VQQARDVEITTRDGYKLPATLFAAFGAKAPGVVMIPPIFGLGEGERAIARDYADAGFPVLVPDLFFRTVPGPLGREGAERDKAQARYADFAVEQGVSDLADAVAALRKLPECNGRAVVFGYCFGGRYAYLAVTRGFADGGVSFHGTKIGLDLDEAANVRAPLQIHVGDQDASIPMEEVERTQRALAGNPHAAVHVYPGAVHGFTGKGRPSFYEIADRSSRDGALALLRSLA
jgi:carboxymethylenebutenolidase